MKENLPIHTPIIQISLAEYNRLRVQETFLTCLQQAGVDNWEGYEFALEKFEEVCPPEISGS